jgi:GH25 family lysozyme M1 (1,4-beta-N-acetylmuramidase)
VNYTVGVDVTSLYQGSQIGTLAYWQYLKSHGYGFAILKATEGTSYTDPYLQAAWQYYNQEFPGAGPWLYHYLDWNSGTGASQAQHFYNTLKGLTNPVVTWATLQLIVDIEETGGSGSPSMTVVNDFINELSSLHGGTYNFWIYTNEDTWKTKLGNPSTWSHLGLYLAAMNGQTWCPSYTFGGWTNWGIMQYGQATVEGKTTDLDELNLG